MTDYTAADWQAEMGALRTAHAPPPTCPHCRRTGFYGPRQDEGHRRFRMCKFCGFTQDLDQAPVFYVATAHACHAWRRVAGAPYIWWVSPAAEVYACAYCSSSVTVQSARIAKPSDDPSHPWWQVPQGLSYKESLAYWEAQGYYRPFM